MASPIRVIWYTDPHNIWCWGFEPTVRRLEVRYPDRVEIETRQGGLFEDFSPVREQWARMSGGRWKDSVRTFFEAVSSQHRMPMNADAMLDSSDDFNSTWPACIAAKAADLQGPGQGWRYLRRLRQAWCLEGRGSSPGGRTHQSERGDSAESDPTIRHAGHHRARGGPRNDRRRRGNPPRGTGRPR